MDEQQTSQPSERAGEQEQIVITLELDNVERGGDPAQVLAVGNRTVADVLQGPYKQRQHYTGRKGGFLVQFVVPTAQFILQYHTEIAEAITDLSGLVTIFSGVLPILQKLLRAHSKQVGKEESECHPLKIEVEIDGASIRIETSDITQAEAALKLAQRFRSAHPGVKPRSASQSTITIRSQVPPRKRPTRR